jgi:hypothetical protein
MNKRYFDNLEEVICFFSRLKSLICPHCWNEGFLIKHGFLRGYAEGQCSEMVERGCRIFCSNRKNRRGCGRTFSILYSAFIKNRIITAKTIGRFLENIALGMNRLKAFRETGSSFTASSIHRLFNRFKQSQAGIRSMLLNAQPPPDGNGILDPVVQTILHLISVFPHPSCPVSSFQSRFQVSFI